MLTREPLRALAGMDPGTVEAPHPEPTAGNSRGSATGGTS